jgi:hypothetical protein
MCQSSFGTHSENNGFDILITSFDPHASHYCSFNIFTQPYASEVSRYNKSPFACKPSSFATLLMSDVSSHSSFRHVVRVLTI